MNTNHSLGPGLKALVRCMLPLGARQRLDRLRTSLNRRRTAYRLARLQRRVALGRSGAGEMQRIWGYTLRINDWENFYALYKDVFISRIYHFKAERPDPVILDCGSNIGGVILYFKHLYPKARIIGFEPDPVIFPYLEENLAQNGLTDVRLVQAGLAAQEGMLTFYSDAKYGSCLAEHLASDARLQAWTEHKVPCVRLRDYITEPVDFLKMNIEGAEWEVLEDSADRLPLIHEMVIEYHHFPGMARTLHKILTLLDRQGFDYLINDFDSEANRGVQPPFRLSHKSRFCLLIYAKQLG